MTGVTDFQVEELRIELASRWVGPPPGPPSGVTRQGVSLDLIDTRYQPLRDLSDRQ
jgi:hypothetical protein